MSLRGQEQIWTTLIQNHIFITKMLKQKGKRLEIYIHKLFPHIAIVTFLGIELCGDINEMRPVLFYTV